MVFKLLIRSGNHYVLFRRLVSYLRFQCIPMELNCPVVRVKIFKEKGNKINKDGKKKYTGKRISRKRHRRSKDRVYKSTTSLFCSILPSSL